MLLQHSSKLLNRENSETVSWKQLIVLIYTILNKKLVKPKARFIKERSFKEFNEIEFNKDLQIVPFDVAYVFDEIDDLYWVWERLYNNVLDGHAPIRCKKVKESFGRSKFFTLEMRKAIRLRNTRKPGGLQVRA